MITENGIGCFDELVNETVEDDYRIAFFRDHIRSVGEAIADGVEVLGYYMWSPLDIISCSSNQMSKRYGLVYVNEGQFRFHKSKLHQTACCIIGVDQCGTGGRKVFEPVMVAANNLDQFAAASPAITWLLNFRRTLFAREPATGFDHE